MKKSIFLTILFSGVLLGTPVLAQPEQVPTQDPAAQQQMKPGCRMMGGSGMGMGPGMGGGMGMMGHGKRAGQQACLLGDCWKAEGPMAGMRQCPGPRQTVQTSIREINGYQVHSSALKLTEDQLANLEAAEEALTTAMIKQRAELQLAAIQLRKAMAGENPDLQAASKTIDRQAELWKSLQKSAITAAAEARKVLTPEQRRQARQMAAQGMMPMMQGDSSGPEEMEPGMEHHGPM